MQWSQVLWWLVAEHRCVSVSHNYRHSLLFYVYIDDMGPNFDRAGPGKFSNGKVVRTEGVWWRASHRVLSHINRGIHKFTPPFHSQ